MKNIKHTILSDILAGLTVSFAALSLGAAFGIMSGRGAFSGMIGAAIIPIITSLLGGTRIQASGPTAPMTAVTAVIVANAYQNFNGNKHLADEYITLVILMASVFIIIAGLSRIGKFINLVPQVIVLGFMNGIGVLIWFDQIKKIFGIGSSPQIEGSIITNLLIVVSTISLIFLIPTILKWINVPEKIRKFIPSIFISILIITFFTTSLNPQVQHVYLGEGYNSINDYMNVVIYDLPLNKNLFQADLILSAIPMALQLCMLAYLDSLLTSLVIDKMTAEKTNSNKELIAQGMANGIAGFLQGIPGAQATIRSVLLIKEGAKTRIAGVFVGVFALLGFLLFGKLISLITSAVFVGILLKAGLDVMDKDFIKAYLKNNWIRNKNRNIQLLFIFYTTLITVIIDLNVAVISGTVFFYLSKKFFLVKDVEDTFSEISHDEEKGISG
jgi:sulfate permease, SulP family